MPKLARMEEYTVNVQSGLHATSPGIFVMASQKGISKVALRQEVREGTKNSLHYRKPLASRTIGVKLEKVGGQ